MRRLGGVGWALLLTALVCLAPGAAADSGALKLKSAILGKLLGYDRALKKRVHGSSVVVGLITDNKSKVGGAQLKGAFAGLSRLRIQGLRVSVTSVQLSGSDKQRAGAILKARGVNVVYLAAGTQQDTGRLIVAWAERNRVPVAAGTAEQVRAGAAMGIEITGRRPRMLFNLKASKRQGLNLPAAVLDLATVIR
jgi:YfiR/HmsC-like